MQCHYHPEREGTDVCAICGKSICKECGLEIAGKIYCKDCLEKIVGLSLDNSAPQNEVVEEPVHVEQQPVVEESIYQPQEEYEIPYASQEDVEEYKIISDDSPYNIKDNIEYSGGLESSYLSEEESIYQEQPQQVTQNEYQPQEVIQQQPVAEEEYIYPDHDYQPPTTSARQDLEDKYEKYLDDLYFDENEVPLGEQLAKDEAQYGSLTKKEYPSRPVEQKLKPEIAEVPARPTSRPETPEEMEARIRAEIAREQGLKIQKEETGIHNINYKDDKEPMGVVDILLTIILIIVILIVLYYIIYLFLLQSSYPTFLDAVYALKNPQNIINTALSK